MSFILVPFLISCGDDATTTSTSVFGAVSAARTVMTKAVPKLTARRATLLMDEDSRDLSTNLNNTNMAIGGDFGTTPAGFLAKHGDDAAQSSLMYRFKQNVQENICMFSYFLPSTNGIPDLTSGTGTVTITDAVIASNNGTSLASACPEVSVSGLPARPFTVNFQVTDVSGLSNSQYSRKVLFDVNNDSTFESTFYFTITSTVTKFLFIEDSTNDSLCLFDYDSSTGVGKFEFLEYAGTFSVLYRAFLDTNNNIARYVANVDGDTRNDEATMVVTLNPDTSATRMAVSYSFAEANNDTSSMTDGNACVSNTTGAITTNNTLSCTDATGTAASNFTTDIDTVSSAGILSATHATVVKFNSVTNILTAAVAP